VDGPLNENIENDPMQSSRIRPFERSRKNILTRRANHRHIFIVARIKPAPENPPRAFWIRRSAVRQYTAERAEPGRLADIQGRPRRQTGARRRRWASRTGIDASAPLRKPSFKRLPSGTCLQTLKANPALSARAVTSRAPSKVSANTC